MHDAAMPCACAVMGRAARHNDAPIRVRLVTLQALKRSHGLCTGVVKSAGSELLTSSCGMPPCSVLNMFPTHGLLRGPLSAQNLPLRILHVRPTAAAVIWMVPSATCPGV